MKKILYIIGHTVLYLTIFIIIYFISWSLSSLDITLAVDLIRSNKEFIIVLRKIFCFLFSLFFTFTLDFWSINELLKGLRIVVDKKKLFIVFFVSTVLIGLFLYLFVKITWLL